MTTWSAAYTVRTEDFGETVSTVRFEAEDFESAMATAMERKNMFKEGAGIRLDSLKEVDQGRRPIGFGACA